MHVWHTILQQSNVNRLKTLSIRSGELAKVADSFRSVEVPVHKTTTNGVLLPHPEAVKESVNTTLILVVNLVWIHVIFSRNEGERRVDVGNVKDHSFILINDMIVLLVELSLNNSVPPVPYKHAVVMPVDVKEDVSRVFMSSTSGEELQEIHLELEGVHGEHVVAVVDHPVRYEVKHDRLLAEECCSCLYGTQICSSKPIEWPMFERESPQQGRIVISPEEHRLHSGLEVA